MATLRPVVLLSLLILSATPAFGTETHHTTSHHTSKPAVKTNAAACNVTSDNPIILTGTVDSGDRAIAVLLSKAGVFIATGDAACNHRFKGDLPTEACAPTLTMENTDCSAPNWDYRLSWDFEGRDLLQTGDACGDATPDLARRHRLALQSVTSDVTGASVRYQRCGCPTASLGGRYGIKNARGMLALPLLKASFPRMTLVHVVRDVRDVALGRRARTLRDKLAAALKGSGDLHAFHGGEMLHPLTKIRTLKTLYCHAGGPTAPVLPSRCDDCVLDCANVHVPITLERRKTQQREREARAAAHRNSTAGHGHPKTHSSGHSTVHHGRRLMHELHHPVHHVPHVDTGKEAGPPRPNFAGSPEFMECIASCSKFGRPAALPLAAAEVLANITNPDGASGGVIAPIPEAKQMNFSYTSHMSLDVVIPEGAEGLARSASAKVWSVLNLQVDSCATKLALGNDYIRVLIEDFIDPATRKDAITSLLAKLGVPAPGSPGQASMDDLSAVFDHALPNLHIGEEGVADKPANETLPPPSDHYGKWRGSSYLAGVETAAWPALEKFGYELSLPVMKEPIAAPSSGARRRRHRKQF